MNKKLPTSLSLYFDFLRFTAALVVVFHHLWPVIFPQFPVPWPGHESVVVFFVLSGYVISYSANRPGETAKKYFFNRSVRIASVAIPALAVGALVSGLSGSQSLPNAGPPNTSFYDLVLRSILNLLFIAQNWQINSLAPANAPYWSINYEVWYYIIFGLYTYHVKSKRVLYLAFAMMAAGPKILLMMPVWMLGVILQKNPIRMNFQIASIGFFASIVLGFLFFYFDLSRNIRASASLIFPGFWGNLNSANQFLGDFILGLIVAFNFSTVPYLNVPKWVLKLDSGIKRISSYTLSTYLYHMPLGALLFLVFKISSPISFFGLLFISIFVLGEITERNMQRLKNWISSLRGSLVNV